MPPFSPPSSFLSSSTTALALTARLLNAQTTVLPTRLFTTSPSPQNSTHRLLRLHASIPPYPHGPRHTFKRSNLGLYGNTHIQFGNKVSEKGGNRSRRTWKPNMQRRRLWSMALGRWLRVRVNMRVLKTIDKCGGLDEYLLGESPARIRELGMGGWALRWRVMQTEVVRRRWEVERRRLGLVEGGGVETETETEEGGREGEAEAVREFDTVLDEAERRAGELEALGRVDDGGEGRSSGADAVGSGAAREADETDFTLDPAEREELSRTGDRPATR